MYGLVLSCKEKSMVFSGKGLPPCIRLLYGNYEYRALMEAARTSLLLSILRAALLKLR
jgi:hypothetical protein